MKGYLLNGTPMWMHAMKRAVAPGGKIPLEELYDQYGPKHELEKGQEFVEWLKNVKLRDNNNWKIIVEDEKHKKEEKEDTVTEAEPSTVIEEGRVDISKLDYRKMEIADVVNLSVRQAREVLPHVVDLNLLKYSLSEATPRSGKDSLCRLLRKRVRELETQRR